MVEEEEKEIIGYLTDDRNIYCTECILKNQELIKRRLKRRLLRTMLKKENAFVMNVKRKSSEEDTVPYSLSCSCVSPVFP